MSQPIFTTSVPGVPRPQGSLQSGGRGQLFYSNAAVLKPWRNLIRSSVQEALGESWQPTTHAVALSVVFVFKKPVRPKDPEHKVTVPDLDKLLRAVLDSLTGTVYVDDSQVTRIVAEKVYADKYEDLGIGEGVVLRAYRA